MLPSIRHLLDSDPPASQPENSFSCSSTSSPLSSSSTTAMPSTAVHPPLNQKSPGLKQSDMMVGPEQPYLQRNTPQHRESHHHPHPPYEPLHPPLRHSQFREYHARGKMEGSPNGHSHDYGSYHPSESHNDPAFSPLSRSRSYARRDPALNLPAAGSTEESGRSQGSRATPAWQPTHSPLAHGQGASPPHSSHTPVFSSSHRPQPPRTSPHDPSLTSSSSSASPSPSISTTTVMSATLTTDAITSVTQETAAASISDPRPAYTYAHDHGLSARSVNGDLREYSGNGYPTNAPQTEMADREDVTLSPTGGLVQHAPKNTPHSAYAYRDGDRQHPSSSYNRQQPPHVLTSSYEEEPPVKRISRPPFEHSLDQRSHFYSAENTDRHGGSPSRRAQPQEGSQDHHTGHHHSGPLSSSLRRPISPMDAYASAPSHSHERQHPSVRTHSPSPPSPPPTAVSTADGRYERPQDWSAESNRDGARHSPAGAHTWRYGSYSPPGDTGAHSASSPYESHARQLSSDGPSYPPSSNAHHNTHPSLQQQQPPLPLYDHVRESDQRHHPSHPLAHPSYYERQPVLDQSKRHQQPAAATSAAPRETRSPRLMGAQPHGLAARSERLASPSPSHPYHTSSHPPRSYVAHPVEGDVASRATTNGRPQDAHFRSSEGSSQGPPASSRPHALSFTHSAQPRYLRGEGAPSQDHGFEETLNEVRGYAAVKREPDADRLRDGNWSDGAAGQEPRAGHSKRGAQETYSEFRSTLSASYWKEPQRVIRASVSESDLLTIEASQRKASSRSDYPEDDVEEGDDQDEVDDDESDQIDELEEDEEDKEHIRVRSDEGLQYTYRQHPDGQGGASDGRRHHQQQHHQQHPSGFDYDQESKRSFAGYGPPRSRDAPPEFSQRGPPPSHQHHYPPPHSHHPQAHSYHGSPVQPQSQEFSSHQQHQHHQQQQYQSRPMHIPQHPRSYSYPHQHSGPYHQHGGPHYQSLPSSLAVANAAHPLSPKPPNRRGPYLSRQRALLAGLEATSPSSRYQCQYCHKRFSRPSSLRIHTYSHTGERPFKCSEEGCGRQFSVQSNMRRHLRVHRMGRMRPEFPTRD
ncbi:unnamed protein product [Mortierella alpina]